MFRLLLLVFSTIVFTSCFSYKELELGDVTSIKINKISGDGIEIQAGMQINNPNNYKIKIKKIEADLLVNGTKVGKINLREKVVLARRSEELKNFTINTQLSSLLSANPFLLLGGDITLQIKGYAKGKVFLFSKKFPIEGENKISTKDLNLF